MQTTTCHMITCNTDRTEGRGRKVDTGIAFTDEESALAFVDSDFYKPFGCMGTKGSKHDITRKTISIFDTLQDYAENNAEAKEQKLAEEAKEKLTPEELNALLKHNTVMV